MGWIALAIIIAGFLIGSALDGIRDALLEIRKAMFNKGE
jgi:hypothetical protein